MALLDPKNMLTGEAATISFQYTQFKEDIKAKAKDPKY